MPQFLNPTTVVNKIWGQEIIIAQFPNYSGKKMLLKKDFHCSLHFHLKKHETFFIESGLMEIEIKNRDGDSKILKLSPGDSIIIEPGELHRFYGVEETVFFEFSTSDCPEDSYRASKSGSGRPVEWH